VQTGFFSDLHGSPEPAMLQSRRFKSGADMPRWLEPDARSGLDEFKFAADWSQSHQPAKDPPCDVGTPVRLDGDSVK